MEQNCGAEREAACPTAKRVKDLSVGEGRRHRKNGQGGKKGVHKKRRRTIGG